MDYADIQKNLPNGQNMGGLAQTIYYGLWSDVSSWPTEPSSPADIEANGVLTGSLTMEAGKRLFELYASDDSAELAINQVGEPDGISFEMSLSLFHPGLQKKILGFVNAVKNENLVLICEDADGQKYLLGDDKRAAKMVSSDGTGTQKETGGRKGAGLSFVFKTPNIYVYEGDIPLTVASS